LLITIIIVIIIVIDDRSTLNAIVLMGRVAELTCMRNGKNLSGQEQGQSELQYAAAPSDSQHNGILHELDSDRQSLRPLRRQNGEARSGAWVYCDLSI